MGITYLLFMVIKHNGTIKLRACVGGRQQPLWTNKEDESSPTPYIDPLKYILSVNAQDEQDVATVDLWAQLL